MKKKKLEKIYEEFEDCITQIGLDYNLSDEYMDHKCEIFRKRIKDYLRSK